MLEKTLESPLDCKVIKPVHPKGNQPWIFIGKTDAEADAPILWPPDAESQLIGKDPDAGKDWRQKEKGSRGWDGWMASLNQWMWIWASSGRQWKTGKPDVLLHGVEKSRARPSDWTTTTIITLIYANHFAKCFMSTNIIFNYDEKYYYFPIFQMTKQR